MSRQRLILGLLLLGEVFDAVAESSADLIERVVFVATAAQRVLLHATADLIDYLGAQPDHVKRRRVPRSRREGRRVSRWHVRGTGPMRRVQRRRGSPRVGLAATPCRRSRSGPRQRPRSGVEASSLVTGQIDDDGDGPVDPDPRRPPNVLIYPGCLYHGEPGRVSGTGLRLHLDRVAGRMPIHAKVSGQRRHSGVVVAERSGCPCHRPGRQHHPRRRQLVGLAEGLGRTRRFSAAPHPHQPAEHGDPAEARSIMQPPNSAAVAVMIMVSCHITHGNVSPARRLA
jgi:hypothetical protein